MNLALATTGVFSLPWLKRILLALRHFIFPSVYTLTTRFPYLKTTWMRLPIIHCHVSVPDSWGTTIIRVFPNQVLPRPFIHGETLRQDSYRATKCICNTKDGLGLVGNSGARPGMAGLSGVQGYWGLLDNTLVPDGQKFLSQRVKSAAWLGETRSLGKELIYATPAVWFQHHRNENKMRTWLFPHMVWGECLL